MGTMSDYRFSTCEHNGLPCLHVMIDCACEDITQTNIPLDTIFAHLRQQGFKSQETIDLAHVVMQRAQSVLDACMSDKKVLEPDIPAVYAHALTDIIALCQAQFPQVKDGQ
jgi:hypothetical protein